MCNNPYLYNKKEKNFFRQNDFIINHKIFKSQNKKASPIMTLHYLSEKYPNECIEYLLSDKNVALIKCGICSECCKTKMIQWIQRNIIESNKYDESYFVTLTYNPESLPIFYKGFVFRESIKNNAIDFYNCKESQKSYYEPINSLYYRDIQLFLKRLRKDYTNYSLNDKIRYFGCSEYGDRTFRPHYHLIIYNINKDYLKLQYAYTENNNIFYKSEVLQKIWSLGNVIVSSNNKYTIAYSCGYTMKKQDNDNKKRCLKLGIEPIKNFMSRNPGIGYVDDFKKYYVNDSMIYRGKDENYFSKPLNYFDYLLKKEDKQFYEDIIENRLNKNDFIIDFEHRLYQNLDNKKNSLKGAKKYEKENLKEKC